jgi:hypothetical protein
VRPEQRLANKTAMSATWRDPEDTNTAARTAREIRGHRAFDPLRRCLQRHGPSSSITADHITAADILRALADGAWRLWDGAGAGSAAGAVSRHLHSAPTRIVSACSSRLD